MPRTGDDALWLLNGAAQTLASYGVADWAGLPAAHVDWIASLPLCFDDGRRYFVHAGINPAVPLDRQTERDQLWIREPFLSDPRDFGRLIVHGHTPLPSGRLHRRPVRADRLSGEWRRAAWRLDARQYHYPQLIVHIGGIRRSNTCSPIFCRGLG